MARRDTTVSWRGLAIVALLIVSSFAAAGVAWAQDSVEEEEDQVEVLADTTAGTTDSSDVVHVEDEGGSSVEEDIPALAPAPGIETVYLFPSFPDKVIPAGQLTELVVGLSNGGESELKVHGIRGVLVHPIDFNIVVQNFTLQEYNSTVPPNTQATFYFTFTPQRQLLPRDFGLSAFIFYEVDSAPYMSVGYNGTIEITEPRGSISGESVFLLLLGTALLGLLGMWGYSQFQKLSKKSRRAKKVETGTSTDASDNEWLQGTALTRKQPKYTAQPLKAKSRRNA